MAATSSTSPPWGRADLHFQEQVLAEMSLLRAEMQELLQGQREVLLCVSEQHSPAAPIWASSSGSSSAKVMPGMMARDGVSARVAEPSGLASTPASELKPVSRTWSETKKFNSQSIPEDEAVCLNSKEKPRARERVLQGAEEQHAAGVSAAGGNDELAPLSIPAEDRLMEQVVSDIDAARQEQQLGDQQDGTPPLVTGAAHPLPAGLPVTPRANTGEVPHQRERGPRLQTLSEGARRRPVVRVGWTDNRLAVLRRRHDSESLVNQHIFERAGLMVQHFTGSAQSLSSMLPQVASSPSESSREPAARQPAVAQGEAPRFVGILEVPEGGDASPQRRETVQQRARSLASAAIGRRATEALDEQGQQVVADLQACPEYQVIGKELLWTSKEEDVDEDTSRWKRFSKCLRRQWPAMAGGRLYSILMKLGGLSPILPTHEYPSLLYSISVRSAGAWAALHPLVLLLQQQLANLDRGLLTEAALGLGAAVSLLLFVRWDSSWALAETSQQLSVLAHRAGFLNDLARSTWCSALFLLVLFLSAVSLRIYAFVLLEDSPLLLVSFVVSSFILLVEALYLHRLSAAFTGNMDRFVEQMVFGETVAWGREQWKLTMALLSDANNKLQQGLLVLQFTLITFVFLVAFEAVINRSPLVGLAPGAIVAFSILTIFTRVSAVAAQCESTPSMLGRLDVKDESHDSQLIRLMSRIGNSHAGLHILGARISPALVWKGVYMVGGVAMFLVLNFRKELGDLHI